MCSNSIVEFDQDSLLRNIIFPYKLLGPILKIVLQLWILGPDRAKNVHIFCLRDQESRSLISCRRKFAEIEEWHLVDYSAYPRSVLNINSTLIQVPILGHQEITSLHREIICQTFCHQKIRRKGRTREILKSSMTQDTIAILLSERIADVLIIRVVGIQK